MSERGTREEELLEYADKQDALIDEEERKLANPTAGEAARAESLSAKGYKVDSRGRFAAGNKGGPGFKRGAENPAVKRSLAHEWNLFQSETRYLTAFRECVGPDDISKLYSAILTGALEGSVKKQELLLKYLVGIPPRVQQVHHVDITKIVGSIMERRANGSVDDDVVDADYEEVE